MCLSSKSGFQRIFPLLGGNNDRFSIPTTEKTASRSCDILVNLKYKSDSTTRYVLSRRDGGGYRQLSLTEKEQLANLDQKENEVYEKLLQTAINEKNVDFLWDQRAALSISLDEGCPHGPEVCVTLNCADNLKMPGEDRILFHQRLEKIKPVLEQILAEGAEPSIFKRIQPTLEEWKKEIQTNDQI